MKNNEERVFCKKESEKQKQRISWVNDDTTDATGVQADTTISKQFLIPDTVSPGLTSTRNSETVFSVMEILKIKYCFKLNNNHLHMCMRMVLTPCKHRFKMLAEQAGV